MRIGECPPIPIAFAKLGCRYILVRCSFNCLSCYLSFLIWELSSLQEKITMSDRIIIVSSDLHSLLSQ